MPRRQTNPRPDRLRRFDRGMLRSAFVSVFWAAIMWRRNRGPYKLQTLADGLGVHKSVVSRWFRGAIQPNWTVDTIADIAHELDLDLEVIAADRQTGEVFTSSGIRLARIATPIAQTSVIFEPRRGGVSNVVETKGTIRLQNQVIRVFADIKGPSPRPTFEVSAS